MTNKVHTQITSVSFVPSRCYWVCLPSRASVGTLHSSVVIPRTQRKVRNRLRRLHPDYIGWFIQKTLIRQKNDLFLLQTHFVESL